VVALNHGSRMEVLESRIIPKRTVNTTYLLYSTKLRARRVRPAGENGIFFANALSRYHVSTFQTRYTVLFQRQELYETFINKPPLFSNNQPIYTLFFGSILALTHQVREELLTAKYNSNIFPMSHGFLFLSERR
jgi:hypothetical protein